jgi:hypothetical protein
MLAQAIDRDRYWRRPYPGGIEGNQHPRLSFDERRSASELGAELAN